MENTRNPSIDLPSEVRQEESIVVPVIAEELDVHTERRETGRVRVQKSISVHEETIEHPVVREEVEIRRVRVDRWVDGPVPVRYVDDTTIIPVVTEIVRVEKQLVLVEEIHIRKIRTETRDQQRVTVRSEEAHIERLDEQGRLIDPNLKS